MKDQDLDILLAEYRNQKPTDLQMQKWKQTVRQELRQRKAPRKQLWMQLVAASVVGFLIGALVFKSSKSEDPFQHLAKNDSDNATIEYVFTKTN